MKLTVDNRDLEEQVGYLEARVDALVQYTRILEELLRDAELERSNWREAHAEELEGMR